ncbi:hypothetical protein DPMN_075959 [Dreissena polymorpha]|uniref:Uncharacterized protein n=1 Tax=Dreissena polymorpha TaxID=45954 RepID=A0A9D3YM51_DREPO|nr:hypothetical protein DPMN_075959 [Dreissena polymorpha]
MKVAKEEWIEERCIIIDKEMPAGSSNKAYNTPRPSRRTVSPSPVLDQTQIFSPRLPQSYTRSTAYCSDFYNYPLRSDLSLFQNDPRPEADDESPCALKAEAG